MRQNLTTGSVWKTVLRFSLPFLLSYFLQTLYGMADLFIIGRFCGVASSTAVSIGSQVMHMLTVMIVGLAMGAVVTIAQAVGSGDRQKAALATGNTAVLFLLLSLVVTAVLLFSVRPIVQIMSTPVKAFEGTTAYLTICFLGIPMITAYNIISSILRGMGDSKSPMYFILIACIANILLDYLFIGGLDLGPAGAALGTTLAQSISVVIALWVLHSKGTGLELRPAHFKPHRQTMGGILSIGVPVALQDGFIQIAFIAITIFANRRGLNDAAAVGIVEKIICLLFLLPSSMLQTVSALSAQNLGADKPDRARLTLRYATLISIGWGAAAVLFMTFFSPAVIGAFLKDAETVQMGCEYMRGYVWDCIFAGVHFCFSGYFCACGHSGLSFLHNSISIICARLPLSYLASVYFLHSLFPMGLAAPAGSLLSVLICLAAYRWLMHRNPALAK